MQNLCVRLRRRTRGRSLCVRGGGDRFNDLFAASAMNENNFILALMHSFTTTYALANKQAPLPPPAQQEEMKAPEGIFISDSLSSGEDYGDVTMIPTKRAMATLMKKLK